MSLNKHYKRAKHGGKNMMSDELLGLLTSFGAGFIFGSIQYDDEKEKEKEDE
jgi:hypothetical protein